MKILVGCERSGIVRDALRRVEPRTGGMPLFGGDGGLMRWANQTDNGQNRLSPGAGRAMERAGTYPGVADAMAQQWFGEAT